MNVSTDMLDVQSIKQSVGISTMRQALQQDSESMASIIDTMPKTNSKTLELSVTPHKGSNFDKSI